MKRILLCGCNGKMGRVIRDVVSNRDDCEIVAGVDLAEDENAAFPIYHEISECGKEVDVIIDFSHPSLLTPIINYATDKKIAAVLATTGYTDEQREQIVKASEKTAIFFTFNMSLGVNLLLDLAKKAMSVLGGQFDVEVIEKHHNQKIDAPSGTAVMIAEALNEVGNDEYHYVYDRHSVRQKREATEIGIHSIRGGTIVGEHEVLFAGRDEQFSISHTATSKEVFAVGAVNASVFVAGKGPGLYAMKDLLAEI